jgi:hypothetical protein
MSVQFRDSAFNSSTQPSVFPRTSWKVTYFSKVKLMVKRRAN